MGILQGSGFAQIPPDTGLARNDSTPKFALGTVISDTYGNSYRYVKAAEGLAIGQCVTATAKAAWSLTNPVLVDGAITANTTNIIHVDGGASSLAATAAKTYNGYYVSQATASGKGIAYKIADQPYIPAGGEADIVVESTILEAFANNVALLIYNPYVVELVDADTEMIMGVCIGTITSGYYGFVQVGGHCPVVAVGHTTSAAIVLNEPLVPVSAVPGSCQGMAGSAETDIMEYAASPLRALQAVNADTPGYVEAFIQGLV